MSRLGLWIGIVGIGLALGCEASHGATHPGADRDAAVDADTTHTLPPPDGAGDAVAQEDASITPDEAGAELGVAPAGGCGVVRRLSWPTRKDIVRVPNGFVEGPEFESTSSGEGSVRWFVVSEDGARRLERSGPAGTNISLALLPVGSDPFAGVVLNLVTTQTGGEDRVASQVVSNADASPLQDLGPAYYRGTVQKGSAVSFDGARALYVTGQVPVDPLHAFLIDGRGERIGALVSLEDGPSTTSVCLRVVPTQSAGAISFVDPMAMPPELKVFELSAQAEVRQHTSLAFESSGCPTFMQAAADGIFLNLASGLGKLDLRVLRASELQPVTTRLPALEGTLDLLWVHEREPGDLLALFRSNGAAPRMARLKDGAWSVLEAELPAIGEVVPAEAGRLFAIGPVGLDRESADLYEIGCGELDL